MKLIKYLICCLLSVIFIQKIEAKDVYRQVEELKCAKYYALAKSENDLRGIKDVWNKIKESAINSWNYIKSVAENTKNKIKLFIENVKERAVELKNNFDVKIEGLKEKLNEIISDLHGTGELVKLCVKKEQENLEDILKEIMSKMSQCIADEIRNLNLFEREDSQLAMNETEFLRQLDDNIELCNRDMQNVQECLCEIRDDIFDNFTVMENNILKNHFDSRNIADDAKATLVTCSLNNLIDATTVISTEIVNISKCVLEAKGNESEPESEPSEIS